LRQWLPWLDGSKTVSATSAFIACSRRQFLEDRGFVAVIRVSGRIGGVISHHGIEWPNRSTALGYWLDSALQGKGIMTAACRAVVEHAFTQLALHRIVIRCATENLKSRAIPERLGFTLEGIARQAEWLYDHFVDLAIYSALRTDRPK
jgi:ribosomal-protein-serine acetyltransferase